MRLRPQFRSERGTTLLEITVTLSVLAVALSLGMPPLRAMSDRAAVAAARERTLALVHRARAEAPLRGGAELHLEPATDRVWLTTIAGDTLAVLPLDESGVDLRTSGSAQVITLRWSALGWGVVASRTLYFHRGDRESALVISSRGRATRR